MKTKVTLEIEVDFPEHITQEHFIDSMVMTEGLYLHLIDDSVTAKVTSVVFDKEESNNGLGV